MADSQVFVRPKRALFGAWFVRHVWQLIRIYWASADARRAAMLLAGAVVLELGAVYANLHLSDAERRIMDAVQDKRADMFLTAIGLFAAISAAFVLISAYRVYLRQLVEIRWRRGVTATYLERWMSERAYCQLLMRAGEVDNPDQRIAEDIRDFVASALGLSLSLLSALATLVSFGGLLWMLSASWPLPIGGTHVHIPGFLLWVALLYAALSTQLTHVVGRRLVPLNFDRLRYEADFRYGLMRFRDNIEVVTLSQGDSLERPAALARFGAVMRNWWQLITAQRRLTFFTGVIAQANGLVPLMVAAPSFFAGFITLGTIAQIRFAYGQVSGALNWFVAAYQEIARWRANVERLSTFSEVIDPAPQDRIVPTIQIVPGPASMLRIDHLQLSAPDGRPLLESADATVHAGDRIVITGPSGAGKTILLRAIAGVWPFGAGRIEVPVGAHMLFVPQWPYLPLGTLRTVISYPTPAGIFTDDQIRQALESVGLDRLAERLDDTALWDQLLSPHEQQRLAIARVLLNRPQWVFLDKVTSSLDDETEKRAYELFGQYLPDATLISVAHSPAVTGYHTRRWTIAPRDDGPSVLRAD